MDEDRKNKLIKLCLRTFNPRGRDPARLQRLQNLRSLIRNRPRPDLAGEYMRGDPADIIQRHQETVTERGADPAKERRYLRELADEYEEAATTVLPTEEIMSDRYQDAPLGLRRRQRISLDPSGELGGEYGLARRKFVVKYSSDNPDLAPQLVNDIKDVLSGSNMEKTWALFAAQENNKKLMEEAASLLEYEHPGAVMGYLRSYQNKNIAVFNSFSRKKRLTDISEHEVLYDMRRKQSRADKGLSHWKGLVGIA